MVLIKRQRRAFSMIELVFVIVIIGILAAIAVPKFAMTRGDAIMTKAKTTVASIRNSISMERQKRILQGDFDTITKLGEDSEASGDPVFNGFDGNTSKPVLSYPPSSCETTSSTSCWYRSTSGSGTSDDPTKYTFNLPTSGSVVFLLQNNRFECEDPDDQYCKELTQ